VFDLFESAVFMRGMVGDVFVVGLLLIQLF
jgi:hypothetical protein